MGNKHYEDSYIRNLDNVPIYDKVTGEFLDEFDERQKFILLDCIENDVAVRSFAYNDVPAEVMQLICEKFPYEITPWAEIEIWKMTHSKNVRDINEICFCLETIQYEHYVRAMGDVYKENQEVCRELKSLWGLSFKKRIEFCKRVKNGWNKNIVMNEIRLFRRKKDRAQKKSERLSDFINPASIRVLFLKFNIAKTLIGRKLGLESPWWYE